LTVLGGGLAFHFRWPDVFNEYLWIWIAIFYLFLLALETLLVVRSKQSGSKEKWTSS
jgi:hypothetical protein